MNVYFSDFFNVKKDDLDEYGAFNISLINDLPVFIDPFLLFNSDKEEYQNLHDEIVNYLRFLKELSDKGKISPGHLNHLFRFPEVKQNWLGFSKVGNKGSGLGPKFAKALNNNLGTVFNNFGDEKVTENSHLEKLCLIKEGVGKDNISDFTTNLIKGFLCQYTEKICEKFVGENQLKTIKVDHAYFNYELKRWCHKEYKLPYIDGDYILLTPKDILTKDDTWINRNDIVADFDDIIESIPNDQLRAQINDYFLRLMPETAKKADETKAINFTIKKFPSLLDYYIKLKEEKGDQAKSFSEAKISTVEQIYIRQVSNLIEILKSESDFYETEDDSYEAALARIKYLKHVVENNDGYKLFYVKGKPVKREVDLQLMYRLTWYASDFSADAEVNNGRGPVDYKISRGSKDSSLVEFKLASNSKLKQNLENQVAVYEAANQTKKSIKVIMYFNETELQKVLNIMNDLKLKENEDVILIDAQSDNKPSGSNA